MLDQLSGLLQSGAALVQESAEAHPIAALALTTTALAATAITTWYCYTPKQKICHCAAGRPSICGGVRSDDALEPADGTTIAKKRH